ncbi:type II secretion system protein [Candidatus Saccharibacteria bacterium]|nr:type II secretion system protein [Candidatus Saccharibacteria bacterium]
MTKNNLKSKEGFTIIEVVLVLAIAGLIFLMVFIAFPGLQRGQRDTQRRNDMSRFLSQLSQYQTNNRGQVPEATTTAYNNFISNYLTLGGVDTFEDPSTGGTYNIAKVVDCGAGAKCTGEDTDYTGKVDSEGKVGDIYIYTNATCDGEYPVTAEGSRKIAIRTKLEGAGVYCGNN